MKLSIILSFTALSATATLAFPLSPFRGLRARTDLEERDVYAPAPVRRSDVAPTATESASSIATSSDTASATSTTSASEATSTASDSSPDSVDSTDTWLYSTITQNGSVTTPPASTSTLDPTTETASTTTETDYPQSTSTGGNNGTSNNDNNNKNNNNNNNNNNNVDIKITIRIKEVIKVTQVIVVERPVLVAVQVNIKVRQTIIVNQIREVFIARFDTWDQNVVDQLGLVISQQFDILTRSSHSGFDNLSNDQYNQFVSKFISQFEVFQSFKLVEVQQFVTVLESFGVGQLATFFGRSDALFSQDTFSKFNVNNDFGVFVQQLAVMVSAVSVDSFNSEDLFGLSSGSLIVAGSI